MAQGIWALGWSIRRKNLAERLEIEAAVWQDIAHVLGPARVAVLVGG
jgi:hypothetical protein